LVFLFCSILSFAQSPKDIERLDEFNYQKDIVYKIVDGDTLDMIIFFPKEKKDPKIPVMLYTHGGGWGGGNKLNIMGAPFLGTLKTLLNNGIACATIEYRLTRVGISTAVDCVSDCKDAARFLMKNAEKYGFDVDRMGVWGGSAGGHLSLMTALADNNYFTGDESLQPFSPNFLCVVSYYPLTSFVNPEYLIGSNFEKPERFIPILGGLLADKQDLARKLSPVEWINKNSTPVFLLHGEEDKVLPIQQSTYLIEVGKAKEADIQLLRVKSAGHSFNGENISPSMDECNKIAAEYVIEKLTIEKK
jgi:acetyl esterase/lipase